MRMQPSPVADALWSKLRSAKTKGLTAVEAAESGIANENYARVRMRHWKDAGFLTVVEGERGVSPHRYFITARAPAEAPLVTTGGEVVDKTAAMSAGQFAAIRRKLGITGVELGRRLGWSGHANSISRSVRRFEAGNRPIDADLAAKVRALVDEGAGTARVQSPS